jgi:transitional endoplasmic reticulum ATPase
VVTLLTTRCRLGESACVGGLRSAGVSLIVSLVRATIRPYQHRDLSSILQLWERTGSVPVGPDGLTLDQAVELMSSRPVSTPVAEREGEVVGVAVGGVTAAFGWIYRLTVSPDVDAGELAQQLLSELELKLAEAGARKVGTVVQERADSLAELERCGYRALAAMRYLERELPAIGVAVAALEELGAHMIRPGLWEELRGLDEAKQIIERRVILPLAEPVLAERHAVAPPKAIVLFGPPGTGKTTFAKGIASRLAWPFVEIEASEIAGEGPEREAKMLAESFGRARNDLSSAVVFVDEVEDLAAARTEQRRVSPSITNEFLKQIPRMRELSEHVLVCATNWVSRLDPAFLRPGRFDYALPVGPPDAGGPQRHLEPVRGGDHRPRRRDRRAGRRKPAVHTGRHRVRGAQGRPARLRARALRERHAPGHAGRPSRRDTEHAPVPVGGDPQRVRRGRRAVRALLAA